MIYRVTFANDVGYQEMDSIRGFRMTEEYDDVVFGWLGGGPGVGEYVKVEKEDYNRYVQSEDYSGSFLHGDPTL